MTTDPTPGPYGSDPRAYPPPGPYGSDPRAYPPPFPANLRPGGLLVRFLARLIDGIIVGVVSIVLFLVTDTLSNYWVTGIFTGLLTFLYFVVSRPARDGHPARNCSVCACTAPAAPRSRRPNNPRSATCGRCYRSFRSSGACWGSSRSSSSRSPSTAARPSRASTTRSRAEPRSSKADRRQIKIPSLVYQMDRGSPTDLASLSSTMMRPLGSTMVCAGLRRCRSTSLMNNDTASASWFDSRRAMYTRSHLRRDRPESLMSAVDGVA